MAIFRHVVKGPGPAGDLWSSTIHSSTSNTISAAHTAFEQLVNDFAGTTLSALWPTVVQATSLTTTQIDPVTGKNIDQTASTISIVGTDTGAALPQRVSVVVGLRTTLPTRAGRGRMFWPSPSITVLDADGLLLGGSAQSLATSMATAIGTQSPATSFGIFHRLLGTITPVTTVTVGVVLGTQRRRTNKVPDTYLSADV